MSAFVKPSSITSQTGAFTYKGEISSPTMNYIDNSFPNLLNKTGDVLTGNLNVTSTGLITVSSGASIAALAGSTINNAGTLIGLSGSTVSIHSGGALLTLAGASVNLNGTITISGATNLQNTMTVASGGDIILSSGSTLQTNSGSTTALNGNATVNATMFIGSGGFLQVESGGSLDILSGGTFQTDVINSQSGGNITLHSNSYDLVGFTPWQGSVFLQARQVFRYFGTIQTASTTTTTILTIPIPSNKIASIHYHINARDTFNDETYYNIGASQCKNQSGTMATYNPINIVKDDENGTNIPDGSTPVVTVSSGANWLIRVKAGSNDAIDWQIVATVSIN
jgi:hypothetical protein